MVINYLISAEFEGELSYRNVPFLYHPRVSPGVLGRRNGRGGHHVKEVFTYKEGKGVRGPDQRGHNLLLGGVSSVSIALGGSHKPPLASSRVVSSRG